MRRWLLSPMLPIRMPPILTQLILKQLILKRSKTSSSRILLWSNWMSILRAKN
jgi:hypothetical protein